MHAFVTLVSPCVPRATGVQWTRSGNSAVDARWGPRAAVAARTDCGARLGSTAFAGVAASRQARPEQRSAGDGDARCWRPRRRRPSRLAAGGLAMRDRNETRAAPVGTAANADALELALAGADFRRKVTLLGSTGSIGTQTLDIVRERPDVFSVVGLAAGSNVQLLAQQTAQFSPQVVAVREERKVPEYREALRAAGVQREPEIVVGEEGVIEVARHGDAELVVTGIVGCAGLLPTIAAIEARKDIALANKETLIAGGPVVVPLVHKHGVRMTPADSEHSALFQCLQGAPDGALRRILLTASGGAFRDWDVARLREVKVADALKHPNWSMGAKITIDSATLMNKGLEVIEAHYLFGADYDDIDIVVHPQSIIHSMVEFEDTSVLAQLGWPDMRLPLLYSMSWPHRLRMQSYTPLDLVKLGTLTFREPDHAKYPCMNLAYDAGRKGGTMPAVLNAANEKAVELFRNERISYLGISQVIEAVMERHKNDWVEFPRLEDIVSLDAWARRAADETLEPVIKAA